MRKLTYILALLLSSFVAGAQTNQPLPVGSVPISNTLYLAPDSTVWTGDEFTGLFVKVAKWNSVDSLFKLGYTKVQVDSAITERLSYFLPQGQKNQVLKVSETDGNKYTPGDPLVVGRFVASDAQLDSAKLHYIPQSEIFNTFTRFAHGGNPDGDQSGWRIDGKIPSLAAQTNSWLYNEATGRIESTFNTGSFVGFASPNESANYVMKATVGVSESSDDDDAIGLVIAYWEDHSDKVHNQAYGLDPSDFAWPINVSDSLIPKQHTLSVIRNRNTTDIRYQYFVVHNYMTINPTATGAPPNWPYLVADTIATGGGMPGLESGFGPWTVGVTVDLEVVRNGDEITVRTTNFSDAPGGKGPLRFDIKFDLKDARLLKFRGPTSFGYCAHSQEFAQFSNLTINDGLQDIYDLRNGDIWVPNSSGEYAVDSNRTLYTQVGVRNFIYNEDTRLFGYLGKDSVFLDLSTLHLDSVLSVDYWNKLEVDSAITSRPIPSLQDVTDAGNSTSGYIQLSGSSGRINFGNNGSSGGTDYASIYRHDGHIALTSSGVTGTIPARLNTRLLGLAQSYSFPNKSGTFALTNDIPDNFVTTNSDQGGIGGNKGWSGPHRWIPVGAFTLTSASIDIGMSAGSGVFIRSGRLGGATESFVLRGYSTNGVQLALNDGAVMAPQYRLSSLNTAPANATATGTAGEIRIDANYIYICTATNTWKRVAISTW